MKDIEYGFWQNRFSNVMIEFEGFANFSGVKEAAIERFGRPYQPNRYIEKYYWFNDNEAQMFLEYSETSRRGTLYFQSKSVLAEQKAFDANRAKSGF